MTPPPPAAPAGGSAPANDARPPVRYLAPVTPRLDVELITDTAGCKLTGGSGASCWGYNQSNVVRAADQVYALSWRDDMSLVVYRRAAPGQWEASPALPPVPQNGNLLVDGAGRPHVIAGANASWHALFDPPGQVQRFELLELAEADSRFGAAIDDDDRIFVAGGLQRLAWYVLDPGDGPGGGPGDGYHPVAAGAVEHEPARGYHFAVWRDGQAHTFCSDDYFLPGDQYPNQTVTTRNLETGEVTTTETPHGIYPVLRTYYYHNADLLNRPDDWRCTVVSDVCDTFVDGARGTTDQQDLMLDADGLLHLVYYENRQPSREVWAGNGQDQANSRLYHAVGPPGGPFATWCLGAFTSGRVCQTADGRFHYFLTHGRRGAAESLWYAAGAPGAWDAIGEPVRLDLPGPFWHAFASATRAGGSSEQDLDLYWTGAYQADSNRAWYGRLTV